MKKSDYLEENCSVREHCANFCKPVIVKDAALYGNECVNFKKKLPRVTRKEVGMKFWELADDVGYSNACTGTACTRTKKFFDIIRVDCRGIVCGDCITVFTDAINKARGYE